ncbi:MAG TPA: ChaN family lipoprotein [Edaphocola sp.]|nr:ChaN family lipoprotein [Edaphocola sp.]
MKKVILFTLAALLLSVPFSHAQELRAYRVYNGKGKAVSFAKMIKKLSRYDIILFGELHNNSINHWLELKTAEALYRQTGGNLMLGAEMFERDNQDAINRYLDGRTDSHQLAEEARLWPNFKTDYQPLLDFTRQHHLQFVATNIPRRYAAIVAKYGMDSLNKLPDTEKKYMARLPVKVDLATPGYKEMEALMKEHAGDKVMNFISAQAVKDATMAESIDNSRKKGVVFLHINGNYHSKEHGGIYWYLVKEKKWLQSLKVAVISVDLSDSDRLTLPGGAHLTEFNIVLPENMTATY